VFERGFGAVENLENRFLRGEADGAIRRREPRREGEEGLSLHGAIDVQEGDFIRAPRQRRPSGRTGANMYEPCLSQGADDATHHHGVGIDTCRYLVRRQRLAAPRG
jgi:hypothetical protein